MTTFKCQVSKLSNSLLNHFTTSKMLLKMMFWPSVFSKLFVTQYHIIVSNSVHLCYTINVMMSQTDS